MAGARFSEKGFAAVGDQVLVQSGLDLVPGIVVDQYGEPPQVMLVVRLDVDAPEGLEAPTVAARGEDVYPTGGERKPLGSWVTHVAFQREVANAIRRIAHNDPVSRRVRVQNEPDSAGPDLHIVDLDSEVPRRIADVEVIAAERTHVPLSIIGRLISRFDMQPDDRGRLIVSNAEIAGDAGSLLAEHQIEYVMWRSARDDQSLAHGVLRALSYQGQRTRLPRRARAGMKFVVKKTLHGEYRFNLVASNGQVVATSQSYKQKRSALATIESIQRNVGHAAIDDLSLDQGQRTQPSGGAIAGMRFVVKKTTRGEYRFNLVASNGQVVATSESYKQRRSALATIESIQRNVGDAAIDEQSS